MDSDNMVKNILRKITDMKRKHILDRDTLKSSLSQNRKLLEKQRQLDEEISRMKSAMAELNQTMEEKQERINTMAQEVEKIGELKKVAESAELSKMRVELRKKERALNNLREKKEDLERQVRDLTRKNKDLKSQHETALKDLKTQHEEALQAKEGAISKLQESLESQRGASGSQIAEIKQDLESSKKEVERLKKEIENEGRVVQTMRDMHNKRLRDATQANGLLLSERDEALQKVATLQKQMQETQVDREYLETSRKSIRTLQGELESEQRQHKTALAVHEAMVQEHAQEVAQLRERIEQLEKELKECLLRHEEREEQEKIKAGLEQKQKRALKKLETTTTYDKPAAGGRASRPRRSSTKSLGQGRGTTKKRPELLKRPKTRLPIVRPMVLRPNDVTEKIAKLTNKELSLRKKNANAQSLLNVIRGRLANNKPLQNDKTDSEKLKKRITANSETMKLINQQIEALKDVEDYNFIDDVNLRIQKAIKNNKRRWQNLRNQTDAQQKLNDTKKILKSYEYNKVDSKTVNLGGRNVNLKERQIKSPRITEFNNALKNLSVDNAEAFFQGVLKLKKFSKGTFSRLLGEATSGKTKNPQTGNTANPQSPTKGGFQEFQIELRF